MNSMKRTAAIILSAASLLVVAACAANRSLAAKHPVAVPPMPICSSCHTDWRTSLDHRQDFSVRHKAYAVQQRRTCGLCHADAFCADCHGRKEEIKPSDKYKSSPDRVMPHPGDYLNQHRIDGRINPASCIPCHGRTNNDRCRVCHR